MVKIPQAVARRSISARATSVRGDVGTAGAVGKGLGEFAAMLQQRSDRQVAAAENTWISETTAVAGRHWQEKLKTAQQKAPEGAPDFKNTIVKEFDTWRQTALEGAPSKRASRDAAARFETLKTNLIDDASTFQAGAVRAKNTVAFGRTMDALAAQSYEDPGRVKKYLAQAAGDRKAAAATWMLPADATAWGGKAPLAISEAAMRGRIAADPAAALVALTDDATADPAVAMLSTGRRQVLIGAAKTGVNALKTRAGAQIIQIRSAIKRAAAVVNAGFDPGNESLGQLQAAAGASGDRGLQSSIADLTRSRDFAVQARTWSPQKLQNWINGESGRLNDRKGVSAAEADQVAAAETLLANMNTELKRDPLSWAARVGLVDVRALSFSGDGAAVSMQARAGVAGIVADYYGTAPRYMTDEEETRLKDQIGAATPDQRLAIAFQINQGFGSSSAVVMGRLAEDDAIFAHVGGLVGLGPKQANAARQALIGQKALADGNNVLPGKIDRDDWTLKEMGNALAFMPATRAAVIKTAGAIYTASALRRGLTSDTPDEDIWRQSVRQALGGADELGGVVEWAGSSVVLPVGTAANDFEDMMAKITDADLISASVGGTPPVHNDGSPLTAADLLDYGRLVDFDLGRYMVDMSGDGVDFIRGGGPNGYFVLDFNRLQPRLMARVDGNPGELSP